MPPQQLVVALERSGRAPSRSQRQERAPAPRAARWRLEALVLDVDRVEFVRVDGKTCSTANVARLLRSARKWQTDRGASISDAELAELARSLERVLARAAERRVRKLSIVRSVIRSTENSSRAPRPFARESRRERADRSQIARSRRRAPPDSRARREQSAIRRRRRLPECRRRASRRSAGRTPARRAARNPFPLRASSDTATSAAASSASASVR